MIDMTSPSRRDRLCNQIHTDISDMIIDNRGMISQVEVPMITECKGEAVAVANYLRGVGYTVNLCEDMAEFLYTLIVTWK
jgi:hypothetical protein